ncbi:MAG: hypothetical protein D6820_10060 [Lentisphaerae bacterium]|nr:MAG: hypothetical protein D6820_10060 [Lentisphaerota bacterium]
MIITNFHVANSVLPLTVRARVYEGDRLVEKEFKNVKVYRVHKKYDLALLKIESKYRFREIHRPKGKTIATGAKCDVIGNPDSGKGEVLRNSITEGLISSNQRKIEGLDYLQISAAINPGNSGGAVVDGDGALVGVVTFKLTDKEGIGFAIPFAKIEKKDFVDLREKVGNKKLGLAYVNKGRALFARASIIADPKLRRLMYYSAWYFFQQALVELPSSPLPYYHMGELYYSLHERDIAKAYFSKALELDPSGTNSLLMLGNILAAEGKRGEAQKLWLKGAFIDGPSQENCAEKAAAAAIKREQWVTAACLARLAALRDSQHILTQYKRIFADAVIHVSRKSVDFIKRKSNPSEFSLDEVKKLARDEKKFMEEERQIAEREKGAALANKAFEARLRKSLAGKDQMPDEWVAKKMPGKVVNLIPTYGGAVIALAIKDLKKIVLLHTISEVKMKYLNVATSNYLMGAGAQYLYVYHPSLKIIEKFDIPTGKRISAKRLKNNVVITVMVMGLRNPRTAFISYYESPASYLNRKYALLDMGTGRIRPLVCRDKESTAERLNEFLHKDSHDELHASADHNLQHLVMWVTTTFSNGYEYVTLDLPHALFVNTCQHKTFGPMQISSDGEFVFSADGNLIQKQKLVKQLQDSWLYCVHDGSFFVQWDKKDIFVRESYSFSQIRKFATPFQREDNHLYARDGIFRYPENRVVASALTNRISILDLKTNTVYTRPLLPPAIAGRLKAGGNSTILLAGTQWTYDLMLPKGFTAKLEDAPEGVTLNGSVLTWNVPAGEPKDVKEILVCIKNAKGEESYRVIRVSVK